MVPVSQPDTKMPSYETHNPRRSWQLVPSVKQMAVKSGGSHQKHAIVSLFQKNMHIVDRAIERSKPDDAAFASWKRLVGTDYRKPHRRSVLLAGD